MNNRKTLRRNNRGRRNLTRNNRGMANSNIQAKANNFLQTRMMYNLNGNEIRRQASNQTRNVQNRINAMLSNMGM